MPDRTEPSPATDAVKALARFLHEPLVDARAEEIRGELKRGGVDTNRLKKRFGEALAQAQGRAILSAARVKRESFLTLLSGVRDRLPTITDVRGQVRGIVEQIYGGDQQAAVVWRNFEEATDADLRTMLEDLTLMDEIDRHDSRPPS